MVGNACTDWLVDTENVMMEFAYTHNLIDKPTYFRWKDNHCEMYPDEVFPSSTTEVCLSAWGKMQKHLGDLNPYDIY